LHVSEKKVQPFERAQTPVLSLQTIAHRISFRGLLRILSLLSCTKNSRGLQDWQNPVIASVHSGQSVTVARDRARPSPRQAVDLSTRSWSKSSEQGWDSVKQAGFFHMKGTHPVQKPKPQRTGHANRSRAFMAPTSRQARPSVFDTDTHSNSCRTVRRLRGLRKADFMAPGAWSVATDYILVESSLQLQAPGRESVLFVAPRLHSPYAGSKNDANFGEQRRSG